jgi:hypothetical protein
MIFGDLSDFSQIFHGIFLVLQICFDPFEDPDLPQIFYKCFSKRSQLFRMFFDLGSMCQTGAAQMGFCFNAVFSIASTPLLLRRMPHPLLSPQLLFGGCLRGSSEVVAAIAVLGIAITAISLYLFAVGGIASGSMPQNPSLLVTASEFTKVGSTYHASIRVSSIGSKAIIKALELYDPHGRNISIEAIYPEPPVEVSKGSSTEILVVARLQPSGGYGSEQFPEYGNITKVLDPTYLGGLYRGYVLVIIYSDVYGNIYRQSISISRG